MINSGYSQPDTKAVLLVEDEQVLREMERSILESHGYRVFEADSARMAFDIWSAYRDEIGLLVSDIILPRGLTGVQLAKCMLDDDAQLKVIFTTGKLIDQAEHEELARLNARFLPKPFTHTDFIQLVIDTLGGAASDYVTQSVA
jgi:DNA-binding NtrC family response regulator